MLEKKHSLNNTTNMSQSNDNNSTDSSKSLRADAKQNREQILEAAYKIFTEKGLSIPIGEIARQAGVGVGTVYRHFPSKEVLFEAVYVSYKQQLTEDAKSLANNTDPGKAFFDFFSRILEDGFTNKALKDAFKSGTFIGTANAGVLQNFQLEFANLLTRAQQVKAVRKDIDVRDLITLMSGFLLAIEQRKGDSDSSNRFNRLLSVVRDGLRYME